LNVNGMATADGLAGRHASKDWYSIISSHCPRSSGVRFLEIVRTRHGYAATTCGVERMWGIFDAALIKR